MSKASDDLRKIMNQMGSEVQKTPEKQAVKPSAPAPVSAGKSTLPAVWLMWGVGLCSAIGLAGLLLENNLLAGLGGVGSLLGVIGLAITWKHEGATGHASSDVAVEVIKRRSLELERDRVRGELDRTHRAMQGINDKLVALQEELVRVKTEKADAIMKKEAELRDRLEEERLKLREGLEVEKKSLLDRERHELEALHKESTDREKLLEESLNREISQLKQELTNREKKLSELNSEIFKLHDQIERQAESTPNEIAQRMALQNKAFEEERKAFQRRLQEQELGSQKKVEEVDAGHARSRMELEKKLEELSVRAMKLQEALDKKVASTSDEAAQHIEQMRKTYEAQKDALQKKLLEQADHYQKKLSEQEDAYNARKAELLTACEAFLKELEAREEDLNKREEELQRYSK